MRDPFIEFDPKAAPETVRNAALVAAALIVVGGLLPFAGLAINAFAAAFA